MFESRLRSYFSGNHSSTRDTSASSSSVYSNRYNGHVLRRTLDGAKIEMEKRSQAFVESEVRRQESRKRKMDDLTARQPSLTDMLEITELQHYYHEPSPDRGWIKRSRLMNRSATATLVIINELSYAPAECFQINTDHCEQCGRVKHFENATSLALCQHCGLASRVLHVKADTSNDLLVFKNSRTKRCSTNKQYERVPLYRRYLSQFSVDAEAIPDEVMARLYLELSTIHLLTSTRCKSTPVANILRNIPGFARFSSQSIKISKLFNGEPVPVLSHEVMQRMLFRFSVLASVSNMVSGKLPSFELISHLSLRLDNHNLLSESFLIHKTANVLRASEQKLKILFAACKEKEPGLSWMMPKFC